MVGLIGFGLSYLFISMLLAECFDDQFSLLFVNITATLAVFLLFGSEEMSQLSDNSLGDKYYYFGYNYVVPQIHNFWIAFSLALLAGLANFTIQLQRHSLVCRLKLTKCVRH